MFLTTQPNDIINYIFSFLLLDDIIRVESTSKRFIGIKIYTNLEISYIGFTRANYNFKKSKIILESAKDIYTKSLRLDIIQNRCYEKITTYASLVDHGLLIYTTKMYHKSNAPERIKIQIKSDYSQYKGNWFVLRFVQPMHMSDNTYRNMIDFYTNMIKKLTLKDYIRITLSKMTGFEVWMEI